MVQMATDEEIVNMLIKEDMLPGIADINNFILTDENNNILTY